MSSKRVGRVGPGHLPLLSAIAEGLVTREPGVYAPYMFDGDTVGTNQVRALARLGLVQVRLSGPPTITEDGERVLRDGLG